MTFYSSNPQHDLDAYHAMLEAAASSGELIEWSFAPFDRLRLPEVKQLALLHHEPAPYPFSMLREE